MSGNKKVLVKIIIIGESGVGKTALLHQYVTGNFIQEHKSTIGADFHTSELNIDNKTITLQIWDTAGQERFQSLGNSFYRGADACVIVYSVTDYESFKTIDTWKNRFINQANIEHTNFPFLLIGNKSDLEERRKISPNQGENWARDNAMIFFETSAMSGENIEKALTQIAINASKTGNAPIFTEDIIADIANMDDNGNNNEETNNTGACACVLI
eukprot:395619_1